MPTEPVGTDSKLCSLCVLPKELQTGFLHPLLGPLQLCAVCSRLLDLAVIGARTEADSPAEQRVFQQVDSAVRVLTLEESKGSVTESQQPTQQYP